MIGDMKLEFLIYGLCIVIALWYVFSRKPKKRTPAVADFSTHSKENDKLVIVDDVREEEMRKIAQEFCEMYNEREWRAVFIRRI